MYRIILALQSYHFSQKKRKNENKNFFIVLFFFWIALLLAAKGSLQWRGYLAMTACHNLTCIIFIHVRRWGQMDGLSGKWMGWAAIVLPLFIFVEFKIRLWETAALQMPPNATLQMPPNATLQMPPNAPCWNI